MAIPVTRLPLVAGEGKTIFFRREELIRVDDALCKMLYLDGTDTINSELSPETVKLITHIIDKINRHI